MGLIGAIRQGKAGWIKRTRFAAKFLEDARSLLIGKPGIAPLAQRSVQQEDAGLVITQGRGKERIAVDLLEA